MGNLGSYLFSGQTMSVGDYLTSPNGMFFAYMQSDGNFCVYRGTPEHNLGALWCWNNTPHSGEFFAAMQSDGNFCVYKGTPNNNQGGLWCWTGTANPEGQYFLAMQDDANLCVYAGTPGANFDAALWCTMKTDSVTFTPDRLTYHLDQVDPDKDVTRKPLSIYTEDLPNDSSTTFTTTIHQTKTVTETRGWSNTLTVSVTAGVEFKVGVPLVGESSVSLSTTVENAYTWNGSESVEESWGFDVSVPVPPHTTILVTILVTQGTVKVPYTLDGVFAYASGKKYRGSIDGVYTGTNSYGLKVVARDVDNNVIPEVQPQVNRALRMVQE